MARARDAHVTLALNLTTLLGPAVGQRGFRLYISDMTVRLEERNCFYYRDWQAYSPPEDVVELKSIGWQGHLSTISIYEDVTLGP
ncbi:hypothetical protein [Thermosynechococcus sp.]|uniref:hypothetical protein n=1 Tax=Thermosynechococcus sp. TaxID=2814275 RepID=UPI00261D4AE6|nr:hypothetical protein [Thermosynechococcus sp.]